MQLGAGGGDSARDGDRLFWAHAAAFGALWGTIEITLGSFLNTLRLPFSGAILSSLGVGLLVAQRQLLPARGASVAVAGVAALCKSLSPGGIILGPMIGIFSEGLIVELFLLGTPRTRIGAATAGGICALWASVQKLLMQYIFYGGTVLELYLALLRTASRWLGIEERAWWAVGAVGVIVAVVGAVGALAGRRAGIAARALRDAPRLVPSASTDPIAAPQAPPGTSEAPALDGADASAAAFPAGARSPCPANGPMHPVRARLAHDAEPLPPKPPQSSLAGARDGEARGRRLLWALAILCVGAQFRGQLGWSAAALGVWLLALTLWDRPALRRLWLPKFWMVSIALALGSGLLLGTRDLEFGPLAISSQGLLAGARMIVRGAFLFALFSWAGRHLANDDAQRLIRRAGFERFGTALASAFELLPQLSARLASTARGPSASRRGLGLSGGYDRAVRLMAEVAVIADALAASRPAAPAASEPRPRLAAVIGPPASGKTTLVSRLAADLRAAGHAVGGVTQPAVHRAGVRIGYDLRDPGREGHAPDLPFARRETPHVPYRFEEVGWEWSRDHIRRAHEQAEVLVVDELGRMEAAGAGHLPCLLDARRSGARLWLLAVRADCVPALEARLGPFDLRLDAAATPDEVERFARELGGLLAPATPRRVAGARS